MENGTNRNVVSTILFDFYASLHSQPVGPKMCSIDILVDLQPGPPTGKLKFDMQAFLTPPCSRTGLWGFGVGISPFDSSPTGCY